MTERSNLIAFLSVVAAIVALAIIAAWKGTQTDLAIMTGLIGVLGTFRPAPRQAAVGPNENVNVNQSTTEPTT